VGFELIQTPAALIDHAQMSRNIARMQIRMEALGVRFRPHVKTTKCIPIVREQIAAGACGITVSTLKEAEQFFAEGIVDILYAVGMVPAKLPQAAALVARGCALKLIVDNVEAAHAIAEFGRTHHQVFEVWLEVDTDQHRSGLAPEGAALLEVAHALVDDGVLHNDSRQGGARLGGVMTHAGSSYALSTPEALQAMAEQERAGCVQAAQRLRAAGFPCPVVSVGSTPTALSARQLEGVTEVRAGVYVFFDLVMANVGVCAPTEIALSVLTTVIGHQREKGWALVDAGWMAMSRDRGTQTQGRDYGYGLVCDALGRPLDCYVMTSANQEHGIVAHSTDLDLAIVERFPVGTQLRILPNHACATGAQFPQYEVLGAGGAVQSWPRFYGW
jgi:D-serine deaminase-like pyridoxal phosphate-dependent protein